MNKVYSKCHVCGGQLFVVGSNINYQLQQVTSDCRPWPFKNRIAACNLCGLIQKELTADWSKSTKQVYDQYEIYAQASGREQLSFDQNSGIKKGRSDKIVEWIKSTNELPQCGALLDIGCGNGAFLRAFGSSYTDWSLFGSELNSKYKDEVLSIHNVKEFYTNPLDNLGKKYDFISMVHVLEHIPDPVRYLTNLHSLLSDDGILLIQVPDLHNSPFDLTIQDHCTHFSKRTVQMVLKKANWIITSVVDTCVVKEITVTVKKGKEIEFDIGDNSTGYESDDAEIANASLTWLTRFQTQLQSCTKPPVGIFGTSISGTWTKSNLQHIAEYFIDEDTNRIGATHLGLPIYDVSKILPGSTIVLPFSTKTSAQIATRLSYLDANFIMPD